MIDIVTGAEIIEDVLVLELCQMPRVVVKRSRAELIRKVETGKAELARSSPFPSGSSSRGTQKKTGKNGQRSGGLSGYT